MDPVASSSSAATVAPDAAIVDAAPSVAPQAPEAPVVSAPEAAPEAPLSAPAPQLGDAPAVVDAPAVAAEQVAEQTAPVGDAASGAVDVVSEAVVVASDAGTVVAQVTDSVVAPAVVEPEGAMELVQEAVAFIDMGGLAMWTIAGLSVITVALILWKLMRYVSIGAWSGGHRTRQAVDLWVGGRQAEAMALLEGRGSYRARLALATMKAALNPDLDREGTEAEAGRVARELLAQARGGLRALELASTVGPLLGLLGTVTGMIGAFHALQEAGSRADPATLAGGIWEALLTTAAGMAVAIPAQVCLTWFESVVDTMRHDMEDAATRILHTKEADAVELKAAE